MKKAIGKIVIVGTMMAMSFGLGLYHAENKEAHTENIIEVVPDCYIDTVSEDFLENYIDMTQVSDYEVSENGLQIYFEDGSGYWVEK